MCSGQERSAVAQQPKPATEWNIKLEPQPVPPRRIAERVVCGQPLRVTERKNGRYQISWYFGWLGCEASSIEEAATLAPGILLARVEQLAQGLRALIPPPSLAPVGDNT